MAHATAERAAGVDPRAPGPRPGRHRAAPSPARARRARGRALAVVVVAAIVVAGAVVLAPRSGPRAAKAAAPDLTTTFPFTTATTWSTTGSTTTIPTTATRPTATASQPATTPAPPAAARVVSRGDPGVRAVTLTFDAGSDAGHMQAILDLLARNRIRATFGITGRFAELHPDLVAAAAAAGHQLVNHSYDHPSFTGRSTGDGPLGAAARADQLRRAEQAIVAATGGSGSAGWFRPPYGDFDDGVVRDVAATGWHTVLMWTVDSLGWRGIPAEDVVARCLGAAEPGAIYLFHVGSASTDAAALQLIVDGLRAAGYSFATAAALID